VYANANVNSRSKACGRNKNKRLQKSLLPVKVSNNEKWTAEELRQCCNVYADGGVGDNEPIQPTNEDNKEVKIVSIKKKHLHVPKKHLAEKGEGRNKGLRCLQNNYFFGLTFFGGH
jgi:hypothetical protein